MEDNERDKDIEENDPNKEEEDSAEKNEVMAYRDFKKQLKERNNLYQTVYYFLIHF